MPERPPGKEAAPRPHRRHSAAALRLRAPPPRHAHCGPGALGGAGCRVPLCAVPLREPRRRREGAGRPLRALREPRISLGRGRTKAPCRGAWRPRAPLHRSVGLCCGAAVRRCARRPPRRPNCGGGPVALLGAAPVANAAPGPAASKERGRRRTHRAELLQRNVTSASEPPDNKAPAGPCTPTPPPCSRCPHPGRAEQLLMQVP